MQKFFIRAKKRIFAHLVGFHSLKKEGEGFDFARMREYELGDDIRKINWLATAKNQKPFVKIFNEESKLQICVIALLNGSAIFGSKRQKIQTIAEISASLMFSAVSKQDFLCGFCFSKNAFNEQKNIKKSKLVLNFAEKIIQTPLVGKNIDYEALAKFLNARIKRKSLVILVGDFFGIESFPFAVASKRHDLVCIAVRDRLEENIEKLNINYLIDPNDNSFFSGELSNALKKDFDAKIKEYDKKLFYEFNRYKIRHAKIYTNSDIFKDLRRLFGH